MNWDIINLIVGIIQIIVSLVLIASVLLQTAKKDGMAGIAGGVSDTFFGKNKNKTKDAMFARITKVCAVIFLLTSLFLSYGLVAVDNNTPSATPQTTATPAPTGTEGEGTAPSASPEATPETTPEASPAE